MADVRQKIEDAGSAARETAREWKESAQDVAERGTQYVRDRLEQANDTVTDMTGKPLGSWTADVQRYISRHPLGSAMMILALGFILGKLLSRD
jgi:ElaB/YqjD/DUF883 family membrane-anchored ribosome-binding protein